MQLNVEPVSSSDPVVANDPPADGIDAPDLRLFVFALFFVFGGITSLNDVIIPKLKDLFTLSYAQAMLVQSAFFAAYFLISLPAAAIVRRVGYMVTAAIGLVTMTAGCLLFVPAAASATFGIFLLALFVLAAGITTVQVVANPLISLLGPPRTASSRLTFAQAFNSLGTTLFPIIGSMLILGSLAKIDPSALKGPALDAYRAAEAQVVVHTYLGLAVAILTVAAIVWARRGRLATTIADDAPILRAFNLLKQPRFAFGALSIFLYVGAEVAIGSLIVSYLTQTDTLNLSQEAAGTYVAFYWGGAMLGRFAGSALLRVLDPGKVLAGVATASIALILISANSIGAVSGWSLLAIGLMNSIMFPTIFTLASTGLGKRAAEGSGVICMAIVGGAIIPPLTGQLADLAGLRMSLLIPALCYVAIAAFGFLTRRRLA
ncbi:sugar MFS transporter [Sphingomonas crocodyli]|uniref:Sugar MFS transporter n=1 Tax=Sphingomonas crocodyli TaxID=1979270 RepID=A0A437M768_9SPHN|nr:sugar MFS transporter [Sphingomonas crocodyli]RVT93477.1 sugar MFS transporter [Sphingomonas crocodyli]